MPRKPTPVAPAKPAAPQKTEKSDDFKVITVNRQARHDYEILNTVEAGIVLKGTEIKSIRNGRVNIRDAYARRAGDEMWLHGAHIAPYEAAGQSNHEPLRVRKLLLRRRQINELGTLVESEGLTIVPLRLFIKRHRAKIELGVARGRRKYDKRQAIAKRDADRRMREAVRQRT